MTKGIAAVILGLAMLSACFEQASQQEASQRNASSRRIKKSVESESLNTIDATADDDVADLHEHDDAPVDLRDKDKDAEPPIQPPAPVTVPAPNPNTAPTLVEFKIKAGTGTGPWNDAATTINLKVGQTFKITNEDTVDHLLHTGGAPFPHARSAIKPGTSVTFMVTKPFAGPMLYDHITTGKVFIVAAP